MSKINDPNYPLKGRILCGLGGLYTVEHESAEYACYAKGGFRRDKLTPLAGDYVEFVTEGDTHIKRGFIVNIIERKNQLLRPPVANVDRLFIIISSAKPAPAYINIDKLCVIAQSEKMQVFIVVNKSELDRVKAEQIYFTYKKCGYEVFMLYDSVNLKQELRNQLSEYTIGLTCAFAGASGAGKSTIINALYPSLELQTGKISAKSGRGRHTTRESRLYRTDGANGYLLDTPGFTLLDFQKFFFFKKEDLPYNFIEFEKYLGICKFVKCTHTKEEGCAIIGAVENGEIPKSRHDSYLELYEDLKNQKEWEN